MKSDIWRRYDLRVSYDGPNCILIAYPRHYEGLESGSFGVSYSREGLSPEGEVMVRKAALAELERRIEA